LAAWLASLSAFLAKRRGLPVIVGIALVIVSFVLQIVDLYLDSHLLSLLAVVTLNVGILAALIGLVLAEPLGK
jgi:hypothetical protein